MYGNCIASSIGSDYAQRVFDGISDRNPVSWNSMISVYSQRGDVDSAFCLFKDIQKEGSGFSFRPTEYAFGSLITAASESLNTGNSLINMYAKCGAIEDACSVFNLMFDKDSVSWSSMISGFDQNERFEDALLSFPTMKRIGLIPSNFTLISRMSFSCAKRGTTITCDFPDGKFSPPMKCEMVACKSRNFNPIRSSARPIDFQKIRIQELLKSEHHEEGRVPRTVECELTQDLVDACIPGDIVTVTGIIRMINNYMDIGGGKSKGKNQVLYYLYLEVVSITNSKSQSVPEDAQHTDTNATSSENLDLYSFSPRDLEFIVKFSEDHGSDVFRQILQSICPSIFGHELVKAGITLELFGGVRKHSMDQNKVPVRGDIHVIVVGDPGLGKSHLLKAAASVSPRGIYVCGNSKTNAGLTVAVVKDPMTSDYAFEAGAISSPSSISMLAVSLTYCDKSLRISCLSLFMPFGSNWNLGCS
ncbi:minichromosome maintenance 8 [Perilla frutescens var. frutescens]|nr:minichromosome maintenance 8 [Perilla frutescens var. frutescens]